MIIFNNTDHPIVVRMGEREFLIEANRFSQETIEEGEYALTVYKQKDNGKIRKVRGKADDEWGLWGYKWCPSLALSGTLIAGRDTKLHIGQTYQRFGFRMESIKGELELLECTVENGELQDAESFFPQILFLSPDDEVLLFGDGDAVFSSSNIVFVPVCPAFRMAVDSCFPSAVFRL